MSLHIKMPVREYLIFRSKVIKVMEKPKFCPLVNKVTLYNFSFHGNFHGSTVTFKAIHVHTHTHTRVLL